MVLIRKKYLGKTKENIDIFTLNPSHVLKIKYS